MPIMNNSYLIQNVHAHCTNKIFENCNVLIENGIIKRISKKVIKTNNPTIKGEGRLLFPGFIDIHTCGGGGGLSIDGSKESIELITKAHAKFGTTGLLLTTISVENDRLLAAVATIAKSADNELQTGSRILGIHIEGPFLSSSKRGAHQKSFLKCPDKKLFNVINRAANGSIKILSLAPELEGADELIKYAHEHGIIVGLAHSEANYEITKKSINNGLSLCVHFFNGMIPFTHKETGPIGAFLTTKNTFISIIPDGVHVVPSAMKVVYKAKDHNKIIIVTDAVTPAASKIKKFNILGVECVVRGNSCYELHTERLAGSALTMNVAIKNFIKSTSCSLLEALNMASLNPARLLKIDNMKGSIEVGKDADLVLADRKLNVSLTMIEGRIVYKE